MTYASKPKTPFEHVSEMDRAIALSKDLLAVLAGENRFVAMKALNTARMFLPFGSETIPALEKKPSEDQSPIDRVYDRIRQIAGLPSVSEIAHESSDSPVEEPLP